MIYDERKTNTENLAGRKHTLIFTKNILSTVLKLQINATNCVYFKGALLIIKPQGTLIK